MGVADLRDAFNLVTGDAATCRKATMAYSQANDLEWQTLSFYGIRQDESEFTIHSDRVPPGGDLTDMARKTAQRLIDGQ